MKCPNCGDNLIFDAKSQLLICPSCDSKFKAKIKSQIAKEYTDTDDARLTLTKFTCSSCGAELAGTYENSALGFCPYCGGESILSSRLNARLPKKIIPFSKNKEDCRREYLSMISGMPFVPAELKSDEFISEIRGIYLPYNIYETRHKGYIDAEYGESHGDTTDYYSLKGNVESSIKVPIDASVQLDDSIGNEIFPYDPTEEKDFDEKYLATYYVELSDVNTASYINSLQNETIKAETRALEFYSEGETCTFDEEKKQEELKKVKISDEGTVLSPAYFLTYKNNDRVCYTVISGTTAGGKAYAEVPVDKRKYTICMLLLAGFIWAILSFVPFIPTFKHTTTMSIMTIMASLAMVLQNLSYDKQQKRLEPFGGDESLSGDQVTKKQMAFRVIFLIIGFLTAAGGLFEIMAALIAIFTRSCAHKINRRYPQINISASNTTLVFVIIMVIATLISRVVFFSDVVVYTLMTLISIPIVLCFMTLINTFNDSCTRPLPHFKRQGGHNSAKDI